MHSHFIRSQMMVTLFIFFNNPISGPCFVFLEYRNIQIFSYIHTFCRESKVF
jgi:hypothetical protein